MQDGTGSIFHNKQKLTLISKRISVECVSFNIFHFTSTMNLISFRKAWLLNEECMRIPLTSDQNLTISSPWGEVLTLECSMSDYATLEHRLNHLRTKYGIHIQHNEIKPGLVPLNGEIPDDPFACEPIWYTLNETMRENGVYHYDGVIGYPCDPRTVSFELKDNVLTVTDCYRFMCVSLDKAHTTPTNWHCDLDMKVTREEDEEEDSDASIPYFRLPRSKDGVSIPHSLNRIFANISNLQIQVPKEHWSYYKAVYGSAA